MANHAATAKLMPKGVNNMIPVFEEIIVNATIAQNDTITATLDSAVDQDLTPHSVSAYHTASPNAARTAVITSYDGAGTLVITVTDASGLAAGDKIVVLLTPR